MKTYNNLYDKMLEPENVKECIKKATKGRKKRKTRWVKHLLSDLDAGAQEIRELLLSGEFEFHESTKAIINESSQRKDRLIAKPRVVDQIVHHLLMSVFKPIVQNSLYEQVYGSIPGRSAQRDAKKFLKRWIRSYKNKRFYVFKYDIKHFYDSVNLDNLKNMLSKKIKDERYLALLFSLINSYEPGLPKGFYSSQWLANFYLLGLDHYIKNEIMAPHYMRYMDDGVILCPNKRKLRQIKDAIVKYMKERLDLELKDNWQIYRFVDKDDKNGRDIDFMGLRFFRNKVILRKSLAKRIYRKACRLEKKRNDYAKYHIGTGVTARDAMSMLSLLGWTKHANVYGWFRCYIKPKVSPRLLRRKVGAYQRRLIVQEIRKGLRDAPRHNKKRYAYYASIQGI